MKVDGKPVHWPHVFVADKATYDDAVLYLKERGLNPDSPQFDGVLNTGQAPRLMNIDSQIAKLDIDHFTKKNIPVLCIHDSFIIQYDKEPELCRILDQATHQVTKARIDHDIKNERNTHHGKVNGNIKGYQEPVVVEYHTPIHIDPTSQYLDRRAKYTKWLELSEFKQRK
jgi:hypothetical protein